MIIAIPILLEQLYFNSNENLKNSFSIYNCKTLPSLTIFDYLKRINQYFQFTDEILIASLIYIDKLIQKTNLALSQMNIHK